MSEADELGLDFFLAATRPSRQDTTFRQLETQRDPNMSRGLAWAETITAPDAARVDMLAKAMAAKQAREREDQLTADRRAREDELLKKKWDREDALAEASKQIALEPYEPEFDFTYMPDPVRKAATDMIASYQKQYGNKQYARDEAEAAQIAAARDKLERRLSNLIPTGARMSPLKNIKAATEENTPIIDVRGSDGRIDPIASLRRQKQDIDRRREETGLTPERAGFIGRLGLTNLSRARNMLISISKDLGAGGAIARQDINKLDSLSDRVLSSESNLKSNNEDIKALVNTARDNKDLVQKAYELGERNAILYKLEGTEHYAVVNPDTGDYYVLTPTRNLGKAGAAGYTVINK